MAGSVEEFEMVMLKGSCVEKVATKDLDVREGDSVGLHCVGYRSSRPHVGDVISGFRKGLSYRCFLASGLVVCVAEFLVVWFTAACDPLEAALAFEIDFQEDKQRNGNQLGSVRGEHMPVLHFVCLFVYLFIY